MGGSRFLTPPEIAEEAVKNGIMKSSLPALKMVILGILAGAFIAFASEGSNMAAFNLFLDKDAYGLGKVLAGSIFGTGLMLVIIAGGELFTGNILILMGVMDKKVTIAGMLKNWFFVYLGNFFGSMFIAWLINASGLLYSSGGDLGAVTIKIAVYKVSFSFSQGFILGILCNWLVCLAVWMAWGAKDISGKILAVFFPILLFITSGFEHSIANMYYIPAGILAKGNPLLVRAAIAHGMTTDSLDFLNWKTFFQNNLFPVTLGNIVGGGGCVALVYWFCYLKKRKA